MNAKQAYAAPAEMILPQARPHQRRLLPYVSVLVLLAMALGLTVVLGGLSPSKEVPTPAAAGESAPAKPEGSPKAEQMLTLSASDIPLLQSLQQRQARLEEREKQLAAQEEGLRALQRQLEEKLTAELSADVIQLEFETVDVAFRSATHPRRRRRCGAPRTVSLGAESRRLYLGRRRDQSFELRQGRLKVMRGSAVQRHEEKLPIDHRQHGPTAPLDVVRTNIVVAKFHGGC